MVHSGFFFSKNKDFFYVFFSIQCKVYPEEHFYHQNTYYKVAMHFQIYDKIYSRYNKIWNWPNLVCMHPKSYFKKSVDTTLLASILKHRLVTRHKAQGVFIGTEMVVKTIYQSGSNPSKVIYSLCSYWKIPHTGDTESLDRCRS